MRLYKRGRTYYIDLRIGKKGNKLRIRESLDTTKKLEALGRAAKRKEELEDLHRRREVKFEDFCKKYIEWAWASKPRSALREEQRLEKIKEYFKGLDLVYLSDITSYHVEQLKAELKKTGLVKDPEKIKGASKATINRYLQILRGMFNKAIAWELYSKQNPLRKVSFYRENSRREALSRPEIEKVIKASKEISKEPQSPLQRVFCDLIILAINTGMRKGEILNLRWKDINANELIIKGKGDKVRSVPLNQEALRILEKQPRKNEYVFDVPNRSQQDLLRRTIIQVRKRSGVDFHFHLLRHYFATSLIEKGVDFITVSSILGHSKLTTSLIYSHTDKERKHRAVEKLTLNKK